MDIFQALNTPRQITEYREWPGDKKGCLFYVPFTDFYENGFGAICLIDAPWRKNDKIGTHNLLHKCEWDMAAAYRMIDGDKQDLVPEIKPIDQRKVLFELEKHVNNETLRLFETL